MGFRMLLCIALSLALLGCAAQPQEKTSAQGQDAAAAGFSVPNAPVPYTAEYVVNDNGGTLQKKVWRSGTMMRMRLGSGNTGVDLFFLGNSAYSCSSPQDGQAACFDVSSRLTSANYDELFPSPLASGEEVGQVDIGSTLGRCYEKEYPQIGIRKKCFTDRGVLAYDAYNLSKTQPYVEYMTGITYSAAGLDFALPAAPQAPPSD